MMKMMFGLAAGAARAAANDTTRSNVATRVRGRRSLKGVIGISMMEREPDVQSTRLVAGEETETPWGSAPTSGRGVMHSVTILARPEVGRPARAERQRQRVQGLAPVGPRPVFSLREAVNSSSAAAARPA